MQDCGVIQSFSKSGQPHDNAVAESFFSSMKQEWLYREDYRSEKEFRKRVADFIQFYNTRRPHAAINYKTPDKMEEMRSNKEKSRAKSGQWGSEY
jgi:transposase InsO family protein